MQSSSLTLLSFRDGVLAGLLLLKIVKPALSPSNASFSQICPNFQGKGERIQGLYMLNFFRSVRLYAVCMMGLVHLSPLAAQSPVDLQLGP
jgi:hypothetical protein